MHWYQHWIKSLLFRLEPEKAHDLGHFFLKNLQRFDTLSHATSQLYACDFPELSTEVCGLKFSNPVGLAAGFDKNAELLNILPSFGFGFIEAGTITAHAQPGNPKPRLWRYPKQEALINRFGFNNRGANWVSQSLSQYWKPQIQAEQSYRNRIPVGLNIGKSKITPIDKALEDYLFSFETLYDFADYFVINVSSPNTPGLRQLQHELGGLLHGIQEKNIALAKTRNTPSKPLFVKLAPDLEINQLESIADVVLQSNATGIIATNTTIDRPDAFSHAPREGGLSGRPLFQRSTECLKHLYKQVGQHLILIGVGGILSAEDAYEKICSGAHLVQVYTGWIYQGPGFIRNLNLGLSQLLKRDGFSSIQQAVGSRCKG